MRMFLSWGRLAGLALFAAALAAGCNGGPSDKANVTASSGEKRIIILINGNSPFWDAARHGLEDAERDLKLKDAGLRAHLEVNDGTPQGQLDKLRQFASQSDIVAVGVSAIDASNIAIANQMRALQKKGVKVITIDSDLDRDKFRDARFAFVGTDNLQGGRVLGKCISLLRPQGGEYITFVGRTGAQNAIERINGVAEGAGPRFKSLDSMSDLNDRTKAKQNVRDAITNHPGLNVLVGIWSYNAPAIAAVVREPGQDRKRFTIVTFDAEPNAVKAMGEGSIDAMVVQNPYQMGYQGTRLMKALVEDDQATIKEMLPKHGEKDGDLYDTGLKVVAPDNSRLKAEDFDKKVEFLHLSDFRKWLDKYHLEGS
jgi:ribose transport system substrate-binding protein